MDMITEIHTFIGGSLNGAFYMETYDRVGLCVLESLLILLQQTNSCEDVAGSGRIKLSFLYY